jgi:hypothetical protein
VCKKPFSDGVFRVCDERPFCAFHSNSDQETRKEPKPKKEPIKPTPTRSKKVNEKMCHQCNEKIFGPCATALGHHYHIGHFQCVYCHRTLSSRVSGK